jgi:cholesterol transport system auxiliary component
MFRPLKGSGKEMRNRISASALLLIVSTLLSMIVVGCASMQHAPPEIHYYTLEYDPPRPAKDGVLPYVVKVEQFQASPLHDSNRMVFKDEDFTRDAYIYRKWLAQPGELVAFFLARDFSASGRFQAALHYESNLPYTHLITGMVEDFYLQARDSGEALLTMTVNLVDNTPRTNGKTILMQKKYRLAIKTRKNGPQGLAEAMSMAMQQISADILDDVSKVIVKK